MKQDPTWTLLTFKEILDKRRVFPCYATAAKSPHLFDKTPDNYESCNFVLSSEGLTMIKCLDTCECVTVSICSRLNLMYRIRTSGLAEQAWNKIWFNLSGIYIKVDTYNGSIYALPFLLALITEDHSKAMHLGIQKYFRV